MIWNRHSSVEGSHAFLSASNYHWINYDEEKMEERYRTHLATLRGTVLHEFAAQCIKLKQKLPDLPKTLNMHVNDAIGFQMDPEVVLYYTENAFGTADAISFKNNVLRIHDLKTGKEPASMKQLLVYAAYFCLEYNYKPSDIKIILRIYQHDTFIEYEPTVEDIVPIMSAAVTNDKIINRIKREDMGL